MIVSSTIVNYTMYSIGESSYGQDLCECEKTPLRHSILYAHDDTHSKGGRGKAIRKIIKKFKNLGCKAQEKIYFKI